MLRKSRPGLRGERNRSHQCCARNGAKKREIKVKTTTIEKIQMDRSTSRPFDFPMATGKSKNLEVFLITSSEGHLNLPHRAESNEVTRRDRDGIARVE